MARDICVAAGERIRKLRHAKGWRQIDLAEHSGVHEVHYLRPGAWNAGTGPENAS
jgi:transcriptional regulator with XRE-family HTH domain